MADQGDHYGLFIAERLDDIIAAAKDHLDGMKTAEIWFKNRLQNLHFNVAQLRLNEERLCNDISNLPEKERPTAGLVLAHVYSNVAGNVQAMMCGLNSDNATKYDSMADLLDYKLSKFDNMDAMDGIRSALYYIAANLLHVCDREREDYGVNDSSSFHLLSEDDLCKYNTDAEMLACLSMKGEDNEIEDIPDCSESNAFGAGSEGSELRKRSGQEHESDSDSISESEQDCNSSIDETAPLYWSKWSRILQRFLMHPFRLVYGIIRNANELFSVLFQLIWYTATGHVWNKDYDILYMMNKSAERHTSSVTEIIQGMPDIYRHYCLEPGKQLQISSTEHKPPSALVEQLIKATYKAVLAQIAYHRFIANDHLKILNELRKREDLQSNVVDHFSSLYDCTDNMRAKFNQQLLAAAVKACKETVDNFTKTCTCGSLLHVNLTSA